MIYYPPLVPNLKYWIYKICLYNKPKFTHTDDIADILGIDPVICSVLSYELITDGFLIGKSYEMILKYDDKRWKRDGDK